MARPCAALTSLQLAGASLAALALAGLAAAAPPPTSTARSATPTPAGIHWVRTLEGIQEYRLDNGLQVLLYPDRTKPSTTVNVTYKVGSRMENYGETGMAHLLEHLMFKGSKHFPDPEKEFAARGFQTNGSTSFDRTNYFATFTASDDNLRWALAQEADAMTQSFISRKDLDSEMTVVRNEFEAGENQPIRVLFKRLYAAMFDWHNYGKESIGNRSDIENVDIAHLQAFYRTYYQPDNAVLIVAGRFDTVQTLKWIAADFGVIARPKRSLPVLWTVEPTQDGERQVIVRRHGDAQVVMVGYHIPSARSTDSSALGVAGEILADTPNGRLHKELVETGIAAEVFVEQLALHDPGMMVFAARVKPGDPIERARDRLIEVVESSFAQEAPTAAELDRVRRDEQTADERMLADPQEFGIALSESIGEGDWRLFFVDRDATQKASAQEVAAAAASYFRRDNRTVALFIPEDHPQRASIAAPLDAEQMLKDYTPRPMVAAGEDFEPTQQNINARTQRLALGDLKLALLPKRTKGSTVNVAMSFRFGDEASLQGKTMVRDVTAAMLGRGSAGRSRQQIADEMTRLKMTGDLFDFQTDRSSLVEALQLTATTVRTATFPPAEFEQLRREWLTALQARRSDPGELSRDAILAHFDIYASGDPRHHMTLQERIDALQALKLEDVKAFYEQFWGTARGEIAIVGDFDPQAAQKEIAESFVPWRSKAPFAEILRRPSPAAPTRLFVDTPDKENAYYRARIAVELRDDDPDAPALILANEILGAGAGLHNRLVDRVRQKDGLSYSIGSGLLLSSRDRASAWAVGAICAPQNAEHVAADVMEELTRVLRDGFTAEEVQRARQGFLQERMLTRSDDAAVAAAWVSFLDLDRSFDFSAHLEDAVRALQPEDLLRTLRRYIDPAQLTVVVAGDAHKGAR